MCKHNWVLKAGLWAGLGVSCLAAQTAMAQTLITLQLPPLAMAGESKAGVLRHSPSLAYPSDANYTTRLAQQTLLLRKNAHSKPDDAQRTTLARIERHVELLARQRALMLDIQQALSKAREGAGELAERAPSLLDAELAAKASAARIRAASSVGVLAMRVSRSASELLALDKFSAEAVFFLGKDLNELAALAKALADGDESRNVFPPREQAQKDLAVKLGADVAAIRADSHKLLANLQLVVEVASALREVHEDFARFNVVVAAR